MPTLNWIGKDKVINHHHDVPFRILDHQYGYTPAGKQETPAGSGNMIIHGDNLEALKALLPRYEGKIKCIYIDPPYNTGNEGWVYNDNVNDPKIRKWLHQVVGKEGEDLSRHDKWLCMMFPRLVLLHKLLRTDGGIFVSIDDNEQATLKMIMDEIFGAANFVSNIIWQKKFSPQNDAKYFSDNHDFVICYAMNKAKWQRNLIPRDEANNTRYTNPDNDPRGPWTSSDFTVKTYSKEYDYPIETPSGRILNPTDGRCWMTSYDRYQQLLSDNRIWFGKSTNNVPRIKSFLSEVQQGIVPMTIWPHTEVGHNQSARQLLKKIFPEMQFPFETPKPVKLIERIIKIASNKNEIVLDSFAGSGTTAHTVLNLNKQDGGTRKFILVEMEEYAETITAERVKRVINGYADVEGTGGSFDYYELGLPLFDDIGNLNAAVPVARIREYIWYSETRSALKPLTEEQQRNPYYLGNKEDTGYYFFYDPQQVTTLDYDFLSTIYVQSEQYVIYADNCLLSKSFMQNNHVVFKKIPRDVARI